jgi:tRNA pseudouridine65 synthase
MQTPSPAITTQPLTILYQDNYIVAINKPAGLLVHKSPIDKYETVYAMRLLRDQLGQWVYPLHRLDRPTSGVLLFGLSSEIAQLMGQQFEQHSIQKTYQAIVRGYIAEEGVIDHALKPTADFKSDKKRIALKEAQSAVTHFQRLGTLELPYCVDQFPSSRYSWVELYPKTGRKHQLRKHMKHLSHPIIGDPKYGKSKHNYFFKEHFNCHRLLLAATALRFAHPVTQANITISAEVDGVFTKIAQLFSAKTN